jgi:hypothetical protein
MIYYNAFVGTDLQGDDCIYITKSKRDDGEDTHYLGSRELRPIVGHLDQWLNGWHSEKEGKGQ